MKRTKPPAKFTGENHIAYPDAELINDKLENRFANIGYPFGGRVPYPPDDCPSPRFHYNEASVKWCDTQMCVRECKPNYCTPYKRYRKFVFRNLGKE